MVTPFFPHSFEFPPLHARKSFTKAKQVSPKVQNVERKYSPVTAAAVHRSIKHKVFASIASVFSTRNVQNQNFFLSVTSLRFLSLVARVYFIPSPFLSVLPPPELVYVFLRCGVAH